MNNIIRSVFALSLALVAVNITQAQSSPSTKAGPYGAAKISPIAGAGEAKYWDYLNFDQERGLLFASLGSHMAVINAATGKMAADITGMVRNHGVALVPSVGRGFISDGDEGSVVIFDLKTFAVLGKIKVDEDADGIQYDPVSNKVWVVAGDANSITPIAANVDPKTGKAESPVALGGKPEFFQMDYQGKAYVNLTDKNEVAVIDTKTAKVVARWSAAPGGGNTAMAIDREHHRLFLGCRNPQKLIVMDANNGRVISDCPIGEGCDAVVFDDGYVFASTRDGNLAVNHETSPGKFELLQTIPTKFWCGTMAVDPKTHTIYLPTSDFEIRPNSFARVDKGALIKPDSFVIVTVSRSGK
jgi:DNA-binding beta-propeller fold protein YncE